MKFKIILSALLLGLLAFSCNAIDDLLTFTISNKADIQIKSGFPINAPFEVPTPDVTTNSSAEFGNNNTKASLVKDVKLRSLNLTIKSPEGKTFSFLKSIHLYISTDGSDEIELAYQDNINSSDKTIELTCTSERLDKYIKADNYKIRTSVTLKETLTQNVSIEAGMRFKVTADPF
jgi:hypothetical protein